MWIGSLRLVQEELGVDGRAEPELVFPHLDLDRGVGDRTAVPVPDLDLQRPPAVSSDSPVGRALPPALGRCGGACPGTGDRDGAGGPDPPKTVAPVCSRQARPARFSLRPFGVAVPVHDCS